MNIAAVRAYTNTTNPLLENFHTRREHHNFRLLHVRLEKIDKSEWSQNIGQRNRTDHFGFCLEILTGNSVCLNPCRSPEQDGF
jgi:hypothetical protein